MISINYLDEKIIVELVTYEKQEQGKYGAKALSE